VGCDWVISSSLWYGDGAGNTIEENSSVFFVIRMLSLSLKIVICETESDIEYYSVKKAGQAQSEN